MGPAIVKRFCTDPSSRNYYGITDGTKWFHYYYTTEGQAQAVLETANYFRDPMSMKVNISYDHPAKLIGLPPVVPAISEAQEPQYCDECGADIPEDAESVMGSYHRDTCSCYVKPKECKGKGAARSLAVLILTPNIQRWLESHDPKALEQARLSLEPFGYPDLDALKKKLDL